MKSPLQILKDARAFLSDEKRWTTGQLVKIGDDGERCLCLGGALYAAAGYRVVDKDIETWVKNPNTSNMNAAWELVRLAMPPQYEHSTADLNDKGGHADVLAVLDKAIEIAKGIK